MALNNEGGQPLSQSSPHLSLGFLSTAAIHQPCHQVRVKVSPRSEVSTCSGQGTMEMEPFKLQIDNSVLFCLGSQHKFS